VALRFGLLAVVVLSPAGGLFAAESFKAAGTEFDARRSVVLSGDARSVVVVEFLHHGEITPDGRNVAVVAKNHDLAPLRVLQVGPGDFCRLAFEPIKHQTHYTILYGGDPLAADKLPPWTNTDGLLLETRRLVPCDLRRFESVREAFASAEPLGAGYVGTVQHAVNPFRLTPGPFMSRYHGRLHIEEAGQYTFWTASQDCSFLLVDGRVVVDAPGRHWPMGRARPGSGQTIRLVAGPHEFDYYHVAAGDAAMMVAAWLPGAPDRTSRPALIPPEAFRARAISRAVAGPPETRKARLMPDFTATIIGEVPLPDDALPLVGVMFKDASPQNLIYGSSVRWDFGDGQTSGEPNPTHVFLKPGLHPVTLSHRRGSRTVAVTNRIEVGPPVRTWMSTEKPHTLDDYLPLLRTYDPRTLGADEVSHLVSAYLWKADTIAASLEAAQSSDSDEPRQQSHLDRAPRRERKSRSRNRPTAQTELVKKTAGSPEMMRQYQQMAVDAARAALAGGSAAKGDKTLLALARAVAPVARFDLGDSPSALDIWEAAAVRMTDPRHRAECQGEAADVVVVSDLLDARRAQSLLDAAAEELTGRDGPVASRSQRIRGDCCAMAGDRAAAERAYAEADRLLGPRGNHEEQTARRGARSRSTEQFLRTCRWARAGREIDRWQDEFPSDKLGGYLSLLYARYWAGREKHAQAVALAEAIVAVNPDSPYADQLLYLAAACESKQGRPARAVAILNQLLKDYPGSPLVDEVKRRLRKDE